MSIGHEIGRALSFAAGMTWEILWALILGFTLSGVVQAVVSKREMRRLMPDASPRTLLVSSGLGAASSSCSYASVALVTFYVTMVAAGLIVEFVFQGLGIERTDRSAKVIEASVAWNYTTVLNIIFLSLAAGLIWRYFRYGGGRKMLKMMNAPMEHSHHADHGHVQRGPDHPQPVQ
jgi:uncharacterized membrane protein YraQ (UPF0718 family)